MIIAIIIILILGILETIAYMHDKDGLELLWTITFYLLAILFIYLKIKL